MIDYIKGNIVELTPTDVLLDASSFGYRVQITLHTHDDIKGKKEIRLYTHLHVKNEGQSLSAFDLYGFSTIEEREYFKTIIGVSGIGTSTARLMLSSLKPQEIALAIAHEDVATITSIKGLGPKTAKRMILELKDKLSPTNPLDSKNEHKIGNTIANEALSALVMLGFAKNQAQKAIQKTLKEDNQISVEELIKVCLKQL